MGKYTYNAGFSAETLVEVYKLRLLHHSVEEIKKRTRVSNPSDIFARINMRVTGAIRDKDPNAPYTAAVKILQKEGYIKQEMAAPKPKHQPPSVFHRENAVIDAPTNDMYVKLQESFDAFTSTLEEFVTKEVDKRTRDVKTQLETATAHIKDLEKIGEEAKTSNWIRNLKNKFGE